jgi:hypothetical protein
MKKYSFTNWLMGKWKSGYLTVQVRSIGHKWVWLKLPNRKQFTKISRLEWDQITKLKDFKEEV